jgi:hypothetical protein
MLKEINYKQKYISLDLVKEIKNYFEKINDSLLASRGPFSSIKCALGWAGCWDRSLHLERLDNPIHQVIEKLKQDYGNFFIQECSIRYLSAPFLPHSDVRNLDWIKRMKQSNYKEGFTFLIPLSWKDDYHPGTAFFNCPPNINEPLYVDMLDILPRYADDYVHKNTDMMNFSVRDTVRWNNPGDLISWENWQWHSSCHFGDHDYPYSKDSWVKEFISIETYF